MKRQLLALGFAVSTIGSIALSANAIPINGNNATKGKLINVTFLEADTSIVASGVAFDSGNSTQMKPDFRVEIYINNTLVRSQNAPINKEIHRFGLTATQRIALSEIPIKIKLFDKDSKALEAIDIEPTSGKVVNLIYKPATGEVFTIGDSSQPIKIGNSGTRIAREGLGDGDKRGVAYFSINHTN